MDNEKWYRVWLGTFLAILWFCRPNFWPITIMTVASIGMFVYDNYIFKEKRAS